MKKIFTLFCAVLLAGSYASADGFWARSFVTITSNGTLYNYGIATNQTWTCDGNWVSNTVFDTFDFGTPTTLVLNGGYGESGSYGVDDFIDASSFILYYRAYLTTGTAGSWNSIPLNNLFYSNGDRLTPTSTLNSIYNNVSAGIDIRALVGNAVGNYTLEVVLAKTQYWQTTASTWITANGNQTAAYVPATTTGYKATFSVSSTSGVELKKVPSLKISTKTGIINASFEGTAQVELYTINGQLIRSVKAESQFSEAVNKGAYILRVNGDTHKVLVY